MKRASKRRHSHPGCRFVGTGGVLLCCALTIPGTAIAQDEDLMVPPPPDAVRTGHGSRDVAFVSQLSRAEVLDYYREELGDRVQDIKDASRDLENLGGAGPTIERKRVVVDTVEVVPGESGDGTWHLGALVTTWSGSYERIGCSPEIMEELDEIIDAGHASRGDRDEFCDRFGYLENAFLHLDGEPDSALPSRRDVHFMQEQIDELYEQSVEQAYREGSGAGGGGASAPDPEELMMEMQRLQAEGKHQEAAELAQQLQSGFQEQSAAAAGGTSREVAENAWDVWVEHNRTLEDYVTHLTIVEVDTHPRVWREGFQEIIREFQGVEYGPGNRYTGD